MKPRYVTKRSLNHTLVILLFVWGACPAFSQEPVGNPLVPGYFADPTIKKFGDTWYLYATTDGIKLASGEPQVWISKDFVNWYNIEMHIPLPEGLTNCWAPDVTEGKDGRYYYYMGNCEQGCNIYGYSSDSPIGPWEPLNDGKPVIKAGTGIKNLPALDAQFFWDTDTALYSFFGTWCTSFKGMGWVSIDPYNMFTIKDEGNIPIAQIPHAFEGAYPLKINNRYFLMYSSGDCRLSNYEVRYAYGDSPTGPFKEGINNPILYTSADGTIDSPGHHSMIHENGTWYIVYHRHDNPHSTGGEFRQVCVDSLIFDNDSTIRKINSGHRGIGHPVPKRVPVNIALHAATSASSFYHLESPGTRFAPETDFRYLPSFAVDDNNGTLWKAGNGMLPQSVTIDLQQVRHFERILTQFEYPTFYYQYKIEYSTDSLNWVIFSDRTTNRISGCPMIDDHSANARYVKITVTGTEKSGMFAAIWNMKIFDELFEVPEISNLQSPIGPGTIITNRLLVDFSIHDMKPGTVVDHYPNKGALGGYFNASGKPVAAIHGNVPSVYFDGLSSLTLSEKAPPSLGWNSAYTAAVWVNNPSVGSGECLLVWNSRENMLQSSYAALMYGTGPFGAMAHGDGYVDVPYQSLPHENEWHHIAVTFDGMTEHIYVDGKSDTVFPISLFVSEGTIIIGASGEEAENFTGNISSLQLYDSALTPREIEELMKSTRPGKLITDY